MRSFLRDQNKTYSLGLASEGVPGIGWILSATPSQSIMLYKVDVIPPRLFRIISHDNAITPAKHAASCFDEGGA
jgi:hypothetical protein